MIVTVAITVAVPLALFWPIWPWYLRRLSEGPAGLVAFVAAFALLFQGRRVAPARSGLCLLAALLWMYAASWFWAPQLVRAGFAFLALASWWSTFVRGRAFDLPLAGLLLLALPSAASLEFYFGYPLRRLVTWGTVLYLRTAGLEVTAEGAVLRWRDQLVAVDAPCSGLGMLWTGAFLLLVLAGSYNLGPQALVRGGALTLLVVLVANVLRAGALFYLEAEVVVAPAWLHEGVGLSVFAGAGVLITILVGRLVPRRNAWREVPV